MKDHVQNDDILCDRVYPLIEYYIEYSNDLFTLSFESNRYGGAYLCSYARKLRTDCGCGHLDSFAYPDEVDYNSGPTYSMRQVIAAVREMREYVLNPLHGSSKTNYETFIKIAEDAKKKRTEVYNNYLSIWNTNLIIYVASTQGSAKNGLATFVRAVK